MINDKPLWRKNNRDKRVMKSHSKYDKNKKNGVKHSMSSHKNGRCFKPLYNFLLSSVGKNFDVVRSEALRRIESCDAARLYDIISRDTDTENIEAITRISESSTFSTLYIDSDNILRVAHPEICNEHISPTCYCCTHTFNGKPIKHKQMMEDSAPLFKWLSDNNPCINCTDNKRDHWDDVHHNCELCHNHSCPKLKEFDANYIKFRAEHVANLRKNN